MEERDFTELRADVDDLRVRLDEQGDLARRTHRHVQGLTDSLGQLVSRQRKRERALSLNSFVAYLLFTVLIGAGFFALYRTRATDLVTERDRAVTERAEARERVAELESDLTARRRAAEQAFEYYRLMRSGERSEAIASYADVDQDALTPTEREVFANWVKKARSEIVDAGFTTGLDAYENGDMERAVTELERALAYAGEGPQVTKIRYYLGRALCERDRHADAVRELELALAGRIQETGVTDARYYLAVALEETGDIERARLEYDKFVAAHPNDRLAWTARRKAASLGRAATN